MKIAFPVALAVIAALGFALAPAPAQAGEGFGWTKKTVTLTRVRPPKVLLAGSRLSVKGGSQSPELQSVAQQLQAQLESGLINADNRLTSDPAHPEILIEVTVLHDDYHEEWQTRKESRIAKTGTDAKGKPVFGTVEVQVRYQVVSGDFAVAYKVTDLTKGINLDANSINLPFKGDFAEGQGAPERFSLQSQNVQAVVSRMVQRLAPTRESVSVLIPKGSLEGIANLAEGKLWNKYLEALDGIPPKAKAEDESYRQYALGTAYEALGYSADDPETTLKYLTQAASYYDQALGSNPGEKFFSKPYGSLLGSKSAVAPVDRVKEALTDYQRLKQMKEEYERVQVAKSLPSSSAAGKSISDPQPPKGLSDALSNAAIIEMVHSNLPEDVILKAIDSAQHFNCDVSPRGLIELSKSGVSTRVIQRVQELAAGHKRPQSTRPGGAKKSVPKNP
jgi:hypothetical protein